MLYKTRCNPTHALYGGLHVPYVTVRVTRGAMITHRYTYAQPRCKTSQYRRTFIPLAVFLWNHLADPVFDGVGLEGFKSEAMLFYWPKLLNPYFVLYCFHLLFFLSIGCYSGAGVFGLIGCRSLSPRIALPTSFNNNSNNNNNKKYVYRLM